MTHPSEVIAICKPFWIETKQRKLYLERVPFGVKLLFLDFGFPIRHECEIYSRFRFGRDDGPPLATQFLVLQHEFGPSEGPMDDWKGTFSFYFHFQIRTDRGPAHYCLTIFDIKGNANFALSRLIRPGELFEPRYFREPVPGEIDESEIRFICNYVMGYIQGIASTGLRPERDFYKAVSSTNLLFGYRNGEPFEHGFESDDAWQATRKELADNGVVEAGDSIPVIWCRNAHSKVV